MSWGVQQMHVTGVTWFCQIIWVYEGEDLHHLQFGKHCLLCQVLHLILLQREH